MSGLPCSSKVGVWSTGVVPISTYCGGCDTMTTLLREDLKHSILSGIDSEGGILGSNDSNGSSDSGNNSHGDNPANTHNNKPTNKPNNISKSGLYDNDDNTVDTVVYECDYNVNCTKLYKRIENEDWGSVAQYIDTGYWPGNFFPDPLTPKEQVKTWVTRFEEEEKPTRRILHLGGCAAPEVPVEDEEKKDDNSITEDGKESLLMSTTIAQHPTRKMKWSQLPLHLAIVVDAPLGIVRRLLEQYPPGIQCADDQSMLPLHLALRMGSPDEIVDFLITKFPDAINAVGKNRRTALESAMRSRKKARARIVQSFIDKTHHYQIEKYASISRRLLERNAVIEELQSKLYTIEHNKSLVETDLAGEITRLNHVKNELEMKLDDMERTIEHNAFSNTSNTEEMEHIRMRQDMDVQKKIDALEESARELEEAERGAKQEETELRKDLEEMETKIARSFSAEDLYLLKKEVDVMKSARLEQTRSRTLREMETLKSALADNINNSRGASDDEITAMKDALASLTKHNLDLKSGQDLAKLRADLRNLKEDLRTKRELGRTKAELQNLKQIVQQCLKRSPRDAKGQKKGGSISNDKVLLKLQSAVNRMDAGRLNNKSIAELMEIRKELAVNKKKVQDRHLINQMRNDVDFLWSSVNAQLQHAGLKAQNKRDLLDIKKAIEKIRKQRFENKSNEDLLDLKVEMIRLKEELKEMEASLKINKEARSLEADLDEAIKDTSNSKKKKELQSLKKRIGKLEKTKPASAGLTSLLLVRKEFRDMKNSLVLKSEVKKVREEIALMKRMVVRQLDENDFTRDKKTEKSLLESLEDLESLESKKKFNSMQRDQFDEVREGLVKIWNKMGTVEDTFRVKEDLVLLKNELDRDMSNMRGLRRDDAIVMKYNAIGGINLEDYDANGSKTWHSLKNELIDVKMDIKKVELKTLKKAIDRELEEYPSKRSGEDLKIMEEASDAIDVFKINSAKHIDELIRMRVKVDEILSRCHGIRASTNTTPTANKKSKKKKKGFRGMFGGRGTGSKKQRQQKSDSSHVAGTSMTSTTDGRSGGGGTAVTVSSASKVRILTPPRVPSYGSNFATDDSSEDTESNHSVPTNRKTKRYGNVTKTYGGGVYDRGYKNSRSKQAHRDRGLDQYIEMSFGQ